MQDLEENLVVAMICHQFQVAINAIKSMNGEECKTVRCVDLINVRNDVSNYKYNGECCHFWGVQ